MRPTPFICVTPGRRHTEDLTGRTAVVTGGTVGGLGFAAAELLAQMGATVILTCRSEAKAAEAVRHWAPWSLLGTPRKPFLGLQN